jgi:DNA-directed RNA polymerase subunit M/transcription elongation factor TFIIS
MKIAVDMGGEMPKMSCPKCGKEYDDFDGLSFSYCPACGYCSHPAIDGDDDKLICGVCGREVKRIPVGNGVYNIIEVENENSN